MGVVGGGGDGGGREGGRRVGGDPPRTGEICVCINYVVLKKKNKNKPNIHCNMSSSSNYPCLIEMVILYATIFFYNIYIYIVECF